MRTIGIAFLLAAAAAAGWAAAGGGTAMAGTRLVEKGTEAPDFRLNDHEGRAVRLSDFRGKSWVALAFFPKAMTPG
jgi:cytochrome oxidase Cu insertion factor (SCO1/SenC/PrrC family)